MLFTQCRAITLAVDIDHVNRVALVAVTILKIVDDTHNA